MLEETNARQGLEIGMFIQSESDCESFIANDGCSIIELLHPKRLDAKLDQPLGFSLAIAEVAVNQETYHHVLAHHEVYYVLSGSGEMHVDDETAVIHAGDAVLIPAGSVQWIKNVGESVLKFAAMVSPPWTAKSDRVVD